MTLLVSFKQVAGLSTCFHSYAAALSSYPMLLQAVRDQIRKMVVGGPLVAEDKNRVDAVSDSEDDEDQWTELSTDAARWGLLCCRLCFTATHDPVLEPWTTNSKHWCQQSVPCLFIQSLLQSMHATCFSSWLMCDKCLPESSGALTCCCIMVAFAGWLLLV